MKLYDALKKAEKLQKKTNKEITISSKKAQMALQTPMTLLYWMSGCDLGGGLNGIKSFVDIMTATDWTIDEQD